MDDFLQSEQTLQTKLGLSPHRAAVTIFSMLAPPGRSWCLPQVRSPPGQGRAEAPPSPRRLVLTCKDEICHPLLGLTLWMNSSRATASSKLEFLASLALPGACNLASPGGNPAFAKRTHWISRNFPRWNSQEACIREALWSSSKGLSAGPRKGQDKAMQRQPAPTPPMHFPLH